MRGQGLDFLEFDIPTKVPNGYLFCSQKFPTKSKHLSQSLIWKRGRYVERGYRLICYTLSKILGKTNLVFATLKHNFLRR